MISCFLLPPHPQEINRIKTQSASVLHTQLAVVGACSLFTSPWAEALKCPFAKAEM